MNLGVETETPEEHEAVQQYADLVRATLRVGFLQKALAEAEDALNAECEAVNGEDVEAMRVRLGIPLELLSRVHWARAE